MKEITFFYVRHGRTEYNQAGIIQGQVDSPLCPEGIPVLKETGEILRKVPFTKCFSSPFPRAVNTAEILLAGRDIPVIPLDALKEMSFGDIDGKPHTEHRAALKICHWLDNFRPVRGESAADVRKRVRRAFSEMTAQCSDGDTVLIACHGSYFRYLTHELTGRNRFRLKLDKDYQGIANGSVSVIRYQGGSYELLCYPLRGEQLKQFLAGIY